MRRCTQHRIRHARIGVIGVGGAGCKVIKRLMLNRYFIADFIGMDTDQAALSILDDVPTSTQLLLGDRQDHAHSGYGTNGSASRGVKAAAATSLRIRSKIKDYDMLFLTGGLGGGTGSGALPVIAAIAKKLGILTVAVVSTPFSFEEERRLKAAHISMGKLRQTVDTLIVMPNDRLHTLTERKVEIESAFKIGDSLLDRCIQVIEQLTQYPSLINMDFADVQSIMKNQGAALMTMGIGKGENRATEAAKQATACPILDASMAGAKNVLMHLVISPDVDLFEIQEACNLIKNEAGDDAYIKWGVSVDECMSNEMRILLVATNFNELTNFVVSVPHSIRTVIDRERKRENLAAHFWSLTPPSSSETQNPENVYVYNR